MERRSGEGQEERNGKNEGAGGIPKESFDSKIGRVQSSLPRILCTTCGFSF
jgi:hypothetical protein